MAKQVEREAAAPKSTGRIRYEELHALLRERICMLVYPPGMTLSESELATEFNVSRTPIRRVLQSLEAQGLVETKQSVGTIVTSVELRALREVYAVRMVLAASLGDIAAPLRSHSKLPNFKALLARAEALDGHRDFKEFVRINNDLQYELGLVAGNDSFHRITEQLYYQTIRVYFGIVQELDWEAEVGWLRAEIGEFIRALQASDLRAVGYIRRNHISMNLVRITNYVLGHSGHQ
ncbi:GntR family transcriptional regulator [Hypericibacter terrae]|jgi:DNA-binding GntR family transcriptional regulator|uniref:GntR family transcriptional regulator n=1 Tax=Hypericibacter terrae TaxID=2602015 RepID=A0A5J6MQX6_9PROT|nr:GntR family transcriptional regulator [Hypericibacter terrae]QEX17276.1 GntR family transcriptional regulator [Hypericibacter terrae]